MKKYLSRTVDVLFVLLLGVVLATPQDVFAQDHVVTSLDLQRDVAAASACRQRDLAQLEGFLSSAEAQHAMRTVHVNYQQVQKAIPQLSDGELAMLSARSAKAEKDFAAGTLSNRDLIVILVAMAGLILIIVAVR
jgi:hypothetical protein